MPRDPRADKRNSPGRASSAMKNLRNTQNKISPQCARVQAHLLSYVDGSVSEREQQAVQRHLDGCDVCRRELALYQQSEQALSGARSAAPPAGDLRAAFYARLASETALKPTWGFKVNWRLAVPVLAACSVFLGWLSVPHSRQTLPTVASIRQDSRATPALQKGSLAYAPSRLPRESRLAQPAPSFSSSRRVAPNLVASLSVWQEARARVRGVPQRASRKVKAGDKRAVALLASIGQRREIDLRRDSMRQSVVKPPVARFYAYDAQGRYDTLSESAPPSNTFALGLYYSGSPSAFSGRSAEDTTGGKSAFVESANESIASTKPAEDDGIAIQVRDTRRGFTSSMRLASQVRQRDGQQVLTIHVEDKDASSSTETYAPLPGEVRMETPQAERE